MEAVEAKARQDDLLHVLNALVAQDGGPAGIEGTVCVGVVGGEAHSFWEARLGAATKAGFVDEIPEDADVLLLLAGEDAAQVLDRGHVSTLSDATRIEGDRRLLQRFFKRYVVRTSMVDLRSSEPKADTKSTGRRNGR
jgi:hypothetical protein